MGHLGTQHDLFLVLLNGGSKSGPQFKPMEEIGHYKCPLQSVPTTMHQAHTNMHASII